MGEERRGEERGEERERERERRASGTGKGGRADSSVSVLSSVIRTESYIISLSSTLYMRLRSIFCLFAPLNGGAGLIQ